MSQKQKKILVNGCSHSRAAIPARSYIESLENKEDIPKERKRSWVKCLANDHNYEIVANLAADGKSNQIMIEEVIKVLTWNAFPDLDIVIIATNELSRYNFFAREKSFTFNPISLTSQVPHIQYDPFELPGAYDDGYVHTYYVKTPALDQDDFQVQRTEAVFRKSQINLDELKNQSTRTLKTHLCGDRALRYESTSLISLMISLNALCQSKSIRLIWMPFDALELPHHHPQPLLEKTPLWQEIEKAKIITVTNPQCSMLLHLSYYLDLLGEDLFHLANAAHEVIADWLHDFIQAGIPFDVPVHQPLMTIEEYVEQRSQGQHVGPIEAFDYG